MEIVFATNNPHKFSEIRSMISNEIRLLSLKDIDFYDDIAEDYDTLDENASQKSKFIYRNYGLNCFADDTGLEVDALNGRPGVFSARYAGENKNPKENMQKVLDEMKSLQNRNARFRTVISLIINGKEHKFEGIVNGTLLKKPKGTAGFGYDPIFVPEGYTQTFAEMSLEEKNKISHRANAFKKMVSFLNNLKH